MKLIDRLINFIFSLVMLVLSLVVLLVIFNFIDSNYINGLINDYVWSKDYRLIVIITSFIVFLAGLKTTIFLSDFKKRRKIPIMVSSENGSVQIAQETIESTAKAVARTHEEVKDVNVKMINKNKGVDIYMSILVVQDTNIRTITRQIQEEVKEKVHETTGVLVLNTDIKVKNIVEKNKKIVATANEPLVVKGKLKEVETETAQETTSEVTEEVKEQENKNIEEVTSTNEENV
ncbi:MAG: alkaline shock response membrane anchor protein AmaP [Clostridia bacterium]|nr:alkaline shock response membrane anchor protein AmaP [Clostridia bacterium]